MGETIPQPDRTDPSEHSSLGDITAFQLRILLAVPQAENHESGDLPHGLAVVDVIESRLDQKVSVGAFYPNKDELIEQGLLEQVDIDDRSKGLRLTESGVGVIKNLQGDVGDALAAAEERGQ